MKLVLVAIVAYSVRAEVGCVLVDQASVTAGDLAVAVPEFRAVASNRHLLWAPAPGLTRWLRSSDLQRIAAKEGVAVAAGASTCVQRRATVLSEDQVVSALLERLPAGSQVHVVDYCRLPMVSGQLRFEARPATLSASRNAPLYWRGTVIGSDRRTTPFWASVQIQTKRHIVRASRPIGAETILTEDDLTVAVEQSTMFETSRSPDLADLVGKETSRKIDAHQVIQSSWLRTPPLIRKGQSVRVMVESGLAVLALTAHALSGGKKGDVLLMKNDESGRTFRAEVVGPGKAAVRMEVQSK